MPRPAAARLRRAVAAAAATAALAACTQPDVDVPSPSPSPSGSPTATSSPPAVGDGSEDLRWEAAEVAGYAPDPAGPSVEGLVHLVDPATACVLQLTTAPLAGTDGTDGDDAEATDAALAEARAALDEANEAARTEGSITTDEGPLAARAVTLDARSGPQRVHVRMLMRALTAQDTLVGLVQVCPTGAVDEEGWQALVSGSVLHGAPAGGF